MIEIKKHTHKDGERFYEIEGEFFPSSTTILDAYPLEKGLKDFFQNHTKEQADKLLNDAALQGSKIHHAIELMIRGEEIFSSGITQDQVDKIGITDPELASYLLKPFTEKEDKMMRGFLNWWEDYKPKTIESEKIIYSKKYKYAGTMDWIGYITIKDKKFMVIVDWKTGKGLYKSYDLQIASYAYAYKELYKLRPYFLFLLQLGINKCGYKFQQVKDLELNFKRFLRTLATWMDLNPSAKPRTYQFNPSYKINAVRVETATNKLKKQNAHTKKIVRTRRLGKSRS